MLAVKEGLVGLSVTNAHPSTAPTFGVKPMLGTNPIAVAAPTDEPFPYMFDAATSIAPRGKIEIAARANKPIPEGWVIGADGKSATDSSKMIEEMNEGTLADFKQITGNMMRELRSSPKIPGQPRIYTAGEKEYYNTLRVQAEGVEITPGVQKALNTLRQELNLTGHALGF